MEDGRGNLAPTNRLLLSVDVCGWTSDAGLTSNPRIGFDGNRTGCKGYLRFYIVTDFPVRAHSYIAMLSSTERLPS